MGEGMGQRLEEGLWGPLGPSTSLMCGWIWSRGPPGQHNDYISLLEEVLGLANIHGQAHPEVAILRPGLLRWVLTHHRLDATVQVCLANCLVIKQ